MDGQSAGPPAEASRPEDARAAQAAANACPRPPSRPAPAIAARTRAAVLVPPTVVILKISSRVRRRKEGPGGPAPNRRGRRLSPWLPAS
jgi:hypothetical protein